MSTFAQAQREHDMREPEDHALDLCANCGQKYEDHPEVKCESCEYDFRLCHGEMFPEDTCDQHEPELVFEDVERP